MDRVRARRWDETSAQRSPESTALMVESRIVFYRRAIIKRSSEEKVAVCGIGGKKVSAPPLPAAHRKFEWCSGETTSGMTGALSYQLKPEAERRLMDFKLVSDYKP